MNVVRFIGLASIAALTTTRNSSLSHNHSPAHRISRQVYCLCPTLLARDRATRRARRVVVSRTQCLSIRYPDPDRDCMRRGHVTPSVLQRRRTDSKDMFVAHELNRSELEVANSTVNGRNTGIENRALTVLISLQPSSSSSSTSYFIEITQQTCLKNTHTSSKYKINVNNNTVKRHQLINERRA